MMIGDASAVRVDVDERVDADVEAGLLARLTDRGARDLLAAIDVAAREHPQAVPRLDGAAHEHELLVAVRMIVPTATFGSR